MKSDMLFNFLLYHYEAVAVLRFVLVVLGGILVGGSVLWRLIAKRDRVVLSDRDMLRWFVVLSCTAPLVCSWLKASTGCEFDLFLSAASLLFLFAGSLLSVRVRKKWILWVWICWPFLWGALAPA